jgi:hypothetical protein
MDKKILDKINLLIDENKVMLNNHAELDALKQGYNWTKEFIKKCLKDGKKYEGSKLYPNKKDRHDRYYCIHKYSVLSSKLILIGFLVLENILIIHMQPCNKHSKEGKIYYGLK